jgi:hypothetical protein
LRLCVEGGREQLSATGVGDARTGHLAALAGPAWWQTEGMIVSGKPRALRAETRALETEPSRDHRTTIRADWLSADPEPCVETSCRLVQTGADRCRDKCRQSAASDARPIFAFASSRKARLFTALPVPHALFLLERATWTSARSNHISVPPDEPAVPRSEKAPLLLVRRCTHAVYLSSAVFRLDAYRR